jgi:hypothetical protein
VLDGERRIGLVTKRTYTFQDGGGCDVAGEERQEPVSFGEVVYEEVEPPQVSPVRMDCDLFAFRRKTDLVIQGSAYTYFSGVRMTHVTVRLGSFERTIRVYGERQLARGLDGALRFSEPAPFDSIPVRYDRAYGGVDVTELRRRPAPRMLVELAQTVPNLPIDTDTPFHYARNPCGRGFLIHDDEESLAAAKVPNLEFPHDPITPQRLAAGSIHGWVDAPLAACMDWQSAGWFPRIAYLGAALFPPGYRGPVRETQLGWAAADLVDIPIATSQLEEPPRSEFVQAASAGMSLDFVAPGEMIELTNLHPVYPFCTFRLPDEVPLARMETTPGNWTDLESHLNSVVVRPDADEVVMTWCASVRVSSPPRQDEVEAMRREVEWTTVGGMR